MVPEDRIGIETFERFKYTCFSSNPLVVIYSTAYEKIVFVK